MGKLLVQLNEGKLLLGLYKIEESMVGAITFQIMTRNLGAFSFVIELDLRWEWMGKEPESSNCYIDIAYFKTRMKD